MRTLEEARQLAELMVGIAKLVGRRAIALLSDMNQPLGQAVGNALELCEAIETLHAGGPPDFREHCLMVAAHLLVLGEVATDEEQGRSLAQQALDTGKAWERFKALVAAQGGDVAYVEKPWRLPMAPLVERVPAPRGGFLRAVDAQAVGETAVFLGAGRARKDDPIDHAVGVQVLHKVGDRIAAGDGLFVLHANSQDTLVEARQRLLEAHAWSETPVEPLPLFYGVIK
jgi:pyrimidine-nucleoside phosphorylase